MKNGLTILLVTAGFIAEVSGQNLLEKVRLGAVNIQMENLEYSDYTSCLNMTKTTFIEAFKKEVANYLKQDGIEEYIKDVASSRGEEGLDELSMEAADVAENEVVVKSGVSEDEFYECRSNKMMTDVTRLSNENMAQISEDFSAALLSAVNEEDLTITLPLYKNRKLVSYLSEEQSSEMIKSFDPKFSGKALQSVIFASQDGFLAIVKFYEEELPNFYKSSPYDNVVTFSAKPFDTSKLLDPSQLGQWAVIESVWIEALDLPLPQGKVKIELHFK